MLVKCQRFVLVVVLILLSQPLMAQGIDYSHPLFQSEFRSWNYDKLFDCSVAYEIVVGAYKGLANDSTEVAISTVGIEQAYRVLFAYALMAGVAQGVSPPELQQIHARKSADVIHQIGENRAPGSLKMFAVLSEFMTTAQTSCRPYFEALDQRMRDIEVRVLTAS